MEDKEIAVTKIKIKIGDSEHELSVSQARALRDALQDLLGYQSPDRVYIPYPLPSRPYHPWWEPYWTWTADQTTVTLLASP
jgi:hypothetical protein